MTREQIKPQDHPDFVGGWVWRELEMRWIEKRIAEAVVKEREACAQLAEKEATKWGPSSPSIAAANIIAESIRARW